MEGIAQREAMLLAEQEALAVEELPEDDEITSSRQEELGLDAQLDLKDMETLEAQMLSAGQSSGEGLEISTQEIPTEATAPRRRVAKPQPAVPDQAAQDALTAQQAAEATGSAPLGEVEEAEADSGDLLAEEDGPAASVD